VTQYRLALAALLAALSFSAYMTIYTMGIETSNDDSALTRVSVSTLTPQRLRLVSLIPYGQLNASELASAYAAAFGDKLGTPVSRRRIGACAVLHYETIMGNVVEVGECQREFRFVAYLNRKSLMLEPFLIDNVTESLTIILASLSDTAPRVVPFVVERAYGDLDRVQGYQQIGEWKILRSGFSVTREASSGTVQSVLIYDIYAMESGEPTLPPPDLSKLRAALEQRTLRYTDMTVDGVRICRGEVVYSVTIHRDNSFLGFQALVDAYSGDVLLLVGTNPLGVYRMLGSPCTSL